MNFCRDCKFYSPSVNSNKIMSEQLKAAYQQLEAAVRNAGLPA